MKIKDLFEKWNLTGLKIKTPILDLDWKPSDTDKDAAWDLYVELLTRITTQPLLSSSSTKLCDHSLPNGTVRASKGRLNPRNNAPSSVRNYKHYSHN